ncbi:MAG: M14 family metallopeptidase [Phycisphaerales bacterium]|jgi:hypothetical protein|nr:M14 family metallopeptidase [Phycisphaerales bacterium]
MLIPLILAFGPLQSAPPWDGYLDETSVSERLNGWATTHPEHVRLESYGTSREGRPLLVATIAGDLATADSKSSILVVAALDGMHPAGTEYAVRIGELLLSEHAELLEETTVYILPRANPDGIAANHGGLNAGRRGVSRLVDADRDGAVDENGPQDLNGDGVISQMRWLDPPLSRPATHLPDPAEPRLMKTPDRSKGEEATHLLLVEGDDADGDGLVGEDGPGDVRLDRNFPHLWRAHSADSGPYQLSEPESLALAEFVLAHPRIVAAVVYGPNDSVVTTPATDKKDQTGRTPIGIDPGDKSLYAKISEAYGEHTSQKRATNDDESGGLHSWLYAHRGIPTVATNGWGRPDPAVPEPAEPAEAVEDDQDAPEVEGDDAAAEKKEEPPKPADEEAAGWLAWSDLDRDGRGFIEWRTFEHPRFGTVEIGGMVPGFTMNPPADRLDEIGREQTAFLVALAAMQPEVTIEGPEVETLGGGTYRIRLAMVNSGGMPTRTTMARRNRAIRPIVVRLDLERDRILNGAPVNRIDGLDGDGGRAALDWVIRPPDGGSVTIRIDDPLTGVRTIEVPLPAQGDQGGES